MSRVRGREGDTFASPREQADRIHAETTRLGLNLLHIHEELDVSGGTPLDQRPGLGPAIQAVEAGEADVIVGAYFDRLFRSLTAQAEAVERVERAGGRVLAVDVGQVTAGNAGQWLSGTMMGAVAEYQRRTTVERVRGAITGALGRGVAPYGRVPAGYRKRTDGVYEPDPVFGPVVRAAFERRAAGATIDEVWRSLTASGVNLTYSGVYQLLQSRVYLGELHFGGFAPNLRAHDPIVDRVTWEAVQRARSPSGRKPRSEKLLARLGVLRCGSCGSRMAGSTATGAGGQKYPVYRCGNKECPRQMSIMAHTVETAVQRAVRAALAGMQGRASADHAAREADEKRDRTQAALDAAIRAFSGLQDEPAVLERFTELRRERDAARAYAEDMSGLRAARAVTVEDWDRMGPDDRRRLIGDLVERVLVMPGRGPDRVRVEFFGE